ncbi:hypothetical protein [Paraburkholderia mimosarum]|uniref:hypothetical protein n=1 Tax=Paraburkholderia mimosarum TaxID=312026 RepID=UPI0003F6D319|nr:hypothetical protein [Paraburkholderia mimosarum]
MHEMIHRLCALPVLAVLGATAATAVSLGIATYAGWLRGGLPVERAMNIALGAVAVLYVHLLPVGWRSLRVPARVCACVLWGIALVVVLYAQLTCFMVSQRHAGEKRAALAPVIVTPASPVRPPGRTLTDIARDVAQVSADLARADARRCIGDCPSLKVRQTSLAAQLAALRTEADEAKRREAEQDRLHDQADRNEAMRAMLSADPVASQVAPWLGTTEGGLDMLMAFACAVVLEGAAIIGWLMVSVAPDRVVSRAPVASDRAALAPEPEAVAPTNGIPASDSPGRTNECPPVASTVAPVSEAYGESSAVVSEDDQLLEKIRDAVVTGHLKPTQDAIRKFLRCGQPKAGNLNRLYLARFGTTQDQVQA